MRPVAPGDQGDEPVITEVEAVRDVAPPTVSGPPPYLVVFTDTASRLVALPRDGSVTIGRAPEVELQIDLPIVSRQHAVIVVRGSRATVRDLGSNNGTTVDGVTIAGDVPLRSGAVIGIGGAQLVFHGGAIPRRTIVTLAELDERIADEVERCQDHEHTFAVLALRGSKPAADVAAAIAGAVRGFDRIAVVDDDAIVLVPEVDAAEATDVAARLAATAASVGPAAVGVAVGPRDGADADALIAAARAAVADAPRGKVGMARVRVRTIDLGSRSVVIADPVMERVYELVERVAGSSLPVLIAGATGTGKELAAAALHHFSARRDGPFVPVNCAALNPNLIESELFGHQKGAFSGAHASQPGLIEAAHGGTLFFDEIGELTPAVQAKLLRVVETHAFYPVGSNTERTADVRILAATNRDLAAEVASGGFRADLYYRFASATIWLPPLATRRAEIPILAEAFAAAIRTPGDRVTFSEAAMRRLVEHAWPGNVRQLRNCIEFLATTVRGPVIDGGTVEAYFQQPLTLGEPAPAELKEGELRPIKQEIRELEQRRMIEALAVARGNQTLAAALIEMPLRTFVAKLKQYGIDTRVSRG